MDELTFLTDLLDNINAQIEAAPASMQSGLEKLRAKVEAALDRHEAEIEDLLDYFGSVAEVK